MNPEKFMVIYPSYLDATKTMKQGRRISKEDAVDTPTISDISQALQQLTMRHVIQPHKGYPRDTTVLWDNPGRVKVELPPITEIMNKKMLLRELGKIIPTLSARKQRLERQAKEAEIEAAKVKEEAAKERQLQQQREKQRQQAAVDEIEQEEGKEEEVRRYVGAHHSHTVTHFAKEGKEDEPKTKDAKPNLLVPVSSIQQLQRLTLMGWWFSRSSRCIVSHGIRNLTEYSNSESTIPYVDEPRVVLVLTWGSM
eukprot:CAMPEP_0198111162 /NCGR_PEP_ID=MMETSP1442-20131203/3137_1 /TAXON_ID= /ORGANISM="Craspedostauros australis, Strain CCMP3328" /LENGTH=252 /DNA_ID=CAMNT_0043767495 /DNA_START=408 /DNA_END=1165 /DNA_ORIENTATION=+